VGWISDRHMREGGSIGGRCEGCEYPKDRAPLRKIVRVLRPSHSLFETAWVLLECGHETRSWGGVRARCAKCKEADDAGPK